MEYPRLMGHELSGVVAEGSGSARLPAGTAVVINPYLHCGTCIACRKGRFNCCMRLKVLGVHTDGGMCERIVVPEGNLYPAGKLEPSRCGHGRVPRDRRPRGAPVASSANGDRTLVVGAGPIGIGAALFARMPAAMSRSWTYPRNGWPMRRDKLGFASRILGRPGRPRRGRSG